MRDQHSNARRKAHLFVHLGGTKNSYISANPFSMPNIDTFACQETIFCFTKIFILATKVCIKKIRKWSVFILAVMHALTAGCPVRSCPGRLLDQHLWIIKSAALTMSMGPLCGVLGVVCVKIKAPPSPPWSLGPMLPWCMSRGWVSNNIFLSLDAAHAFK